MKGHKIGYVRVSTLEQNTDRQLAHIELDKIFEDKCSGKDTNRPKLKELFDHVREGDIVYVHDISRMARNTEDLLQIVSKLNDKGVEICFEKEGLQFTGDDNPMQQLMLTMLGAIYQFERSMIKERQIEGIEVAKAKGKYKGKQTNEVLHIKIRELSQSGLNKAQIAKELCCSRTTVYKALASSILKS